MLAAETTDIVIAVIGAAAVILGASLPVAISNRRALKRVEQQGDTGNGRSLGETTHDSAQLLTVIQAQGHDNAKSIHGLHERIGGLTEQIAQVDEKLDQHLEEAKPLREWAEQQMEEPDA